MLNFFLSTTVKLKLALVLHWLMAAILVWFLYILYFGIDFIVGSLTLSKNDSLFEYLVM